MTDLSPQKYHFEWDVELASSPEALWEYVADTDRLNKDMGLAAIQLVDTGEVVNNRKTAQQQVMGMTQQWTEEPFEWTYPLRYSTLRNYSRGFFDSIQQGLEMRRQQDGTTRLFYELDVVPRYRLIGGFIRRSFEGMAFDELFRRYDAEIQARVAQSASVPSANAQVTLSSKQQSRLQQLSQGMIVAGASSVTTNLLAAYISSADDLSLRNIKPYALADLWNSPRQQALETCLYATRAGLLDMSWDLLCPLCRNRKESVDSLSDVTKTVHCEVCHIDYEANFEQSVELTFKPNPGIREVDMTEYCVGGPEVTPHIQAQQLLQPGERREITGYKRAGRYRVRTMTQAGGKYVRVVPDEGEALTVHTSTLDEWAQHEAFIDPWATITLQNDSDREKLFVVERLQWSDQAATAADVTTRQVFRDLFASEALRPNEKISVGRLTLVFTDLRGSTAMYQTIGDAPAFGLVMSHFDVMREVIRRHGGGVVKTIGDAVMAVFQEPSDALLAMAEAQRILGDGSDEREPLAVRVGIHTGSCIAVTLNERLDYFGTAVNMTARLEGLSNGGDIILSNATFEDPGVKALLAENKAKLELEAFETELRGLGTSEYHLWRLRQQHGQQITALT